MNILRGISVILFIFSVVQSASAQDQPKRLSLNDSPIEGQFRYVLQRSDDAGDFKLVKPWYLYTLKKHVQDSLDAQQADLDSTIQLIVHHEAVIDSLHAANGEVFAKLEKAVQEKESLLFIGIPMQKAAYNKLVWTIIVVLLIVTVLALLLFKRSNAVTRETKDTLEEVRIEFETFRKRALEREEGIVRKYHNEINKLKDDAIGK